MKTTPLTDVHEALGARMTDFAGTNMPLQYRGGISHEHNAVRENAGLFDVSHMAEIRVDGPGARAFLRFALLNDAKKLRAGRAHYTMIPNDQGGLIDDAYLYRLSDESWLLVANAANREAVGDRLAALAREADGVRCTDVSDDWALLALQGPGAAVLLDRLVDADLTAVRKNDTLPTELAGTPLRLARTGYTGEDGFEVFARPADAVGVWNALCEAGAEPCGLGARDTLRLEAGFPLFGHELDPTTDPRCTPFSWVVKDKPFAGRDGWPDVPACERRLVGLRVTGRGIPRQGYRVLNEAGEAIGSVTSGTVSPLTRDAIGFAWIATERAEVGHEVAVEIRGQSVSATVSDIPFYRP
ncbi:MAG: glycine cleavage system aminomethyltransferase GcvT [Trueperaceae bacterium]